MSASPEIEKISPLVEVSEYYLIDDENQYRIESILDNHTQAKFLKPDINGLSFGWQEHPAWIILDIEQVRASHLPLYFIVEWPLLDSMSLYYVDENSQIVDDFHVGDTLHFEKRKIFDRHFVFAFPQNKSIRKLILRIHTSSSLQLPYSFVDEQTYLKSKSYRELIQGGFFGLAFVIIFYTLFLWASTKRSAYLHYMLFIATFTVVQAGVKGTGFQYLWPGLPILNDYAIATFGALTLVFLNTFAREFLQINDNPWMLNINRIFIALGLIYALASLVLDYFTVIIPIALTIIFSAIYVILMGVIRLRQGYREARFYLMAWFAMVFGSIIYLCKQLGLLPMTTLTEYSMQIGCALEMMLLSLALADRLNTMGEKLEITNQSLELQVETRTSELKAAIRDLGQANQALAKMSITDRLTGLKNRYYFDELLQETLCDTSKQHGTCLLFIDIDKFKLLNDTYGHVAGDRAIRAVSKVFLEIVHKDCGVVCRYGGEEFAVILWDCSLATAEDLGEAIRIAVEGLIFVEQGQEIPITVSIGIATIAARILCDTDSLIKAADKALYQAKNRGRNCIAVSSDNIGNLGLLQKNLQQALK